MTIGEYGYLWDGSAPEWALLNAKAGTADAPSYTIVNTTTKRALLIGNESVDAEVVRRMLDSGCRVLSPGDWSRT